MGVRSMTVRRFEEIRRRLSEGRGLREIARALNCSRDTVREVRDGLRVSPDAPKTGHDESETPVTIIGIRAYGRPVTVNAEFPRLGTTQFPRLKTT